MPRQTPPRLRQTPNDQPPTNATNVPPQLASVHQSTTPLRKENQGRLVLRPKPAKTSPVVKAKVKAMPKPPPALSDRLPRASNIRHVKKTSPDGNSRRHHPLNVNIHKTPALEKRQSLESVDIHSLGPDSGFSADMLEQPRMASVRQALAMLQESTNQQPVDDVLQKDIEPNDVLPVKSGSSQFSFSDLQKIKQLIASSPPENVRRPRRQNSEPPPNAKKRSFSAHSNCLISFAPKTETSPAPQEKEDVDLSNHLVIDVFRDGRPPKRRRPSLISSTAQLDYRDKMDFDSEDLKCFENLPPEKRSRLLFVCKLKPLLCPDSTMVDYLARIDLRKVARLMSLHPAFDYLSQRDESNLTHGSPASFGGPSPVAAMSVGPSVSAAPPETSPNLKPFTPVPFRAASPPLIQLDCPTNFTGFRADATPRTFSRLLDGYEMSAARERVVSATSLNLRTGLFDFLGVVRSQILDLLSVSPPPVIDVCGTLCAYNELHLCKSIHMQLGYAAVCLLFRSFDQWLLDGFENVRMLSSETKRAQLMQVHKADRFIRRCFLMRIAVDLQDEWRRLESSSQKKWSCAQWCRITEQSFAQRLITPPRLLRALKDAQKIDQVTKDLAVSSEKEHPDDGTIKALLKERVELTNQIHNVRQKRAALRRLDDRDLISLAIQPYIETHDLEADASPPPKSKQDLNTLKYIDAFMDKCEVRVAQTFAARLKLAVNKREKFKSALEMRLETFVKLPTPPDLIAVDGFLHLRQSVSDYFAPSVIQLVGGLRTTIKIGPGNDISKPPGALPTMRNSLSGQDSVARSSAGRSSLCATPPPDLGLDLAELHRVPLTPLPSRVSEETLPAAKQLTPERIS